MAPRGRTGGDGVTSGAAQVRMVPRLSGTTRTGAEGTDGWDSASGCRGRERVDGASGCEGRERDGASAGGVAPEWYDANECGGHGWVG